MNYSLNLDESLDSNLVELSHDDLNELNGGSVLGAIWLGVKIAGAITGGVAVISFGAGVIDGLRGK